MFVNKSLTGFLFYRIERIDLGNFRDKIIPEFNGVVEQLMKRENVIHLEKNHIQHSPL